MNRDYLGEDVRDLGRTVAPGGDGASACVGAGLPRWESFAVEDRQALVSVLIHLARQHVALHSGPRPVAERG